MIMYREKISICIKFLIGRSSRLVILSAVLYGLAFIYPMPCCFFVFIFLVPLFYAVLMRYHLGFRQGIVWGSIVFCLHYHALLWLFEKHAQGALKYILLIFFMLYIAFYAGCWFWISTKMAHAPYVCLAFWQLTTLGYFWVMTEAGLWIFGTVEGTMMSFPLLPLVVVPRCLAIVPVLGSYGTVVCLQSSAACMALYTVYKNKNFILLSILFLTPFFYGFLMPERENVIPDWLATVGFITPPSSADNDNALDYAEDIMQQIVSFGKKRPTITIYIGPETTFPFTLNTCTKTLALWGEHDVSDAVHMLLGSHRRGEDDSLFNTVYWLHQGRIIQTYDKTHTMPFTEKIPSAWRKFSCLQNLFLSEKEHFCSGCAHQSNYMAISDAISLGIYICSELFFMKSPPHTNPHAVITALVNDQWFSCNYMKRLLLMTACFKALAWQRPILYVSHYYHAYIFHDASWLKLEN